MGVGFGQPDTAGTIGGANRCSPLCVYEQQNNIYRTPKELSEKIDPDRIEGVTPKKISRLILQSVEALRKNGSQATVRRSNGKRVIELRRADSVDLEGAGEIVPIDPVEALCGDLRAVSGCGK